MSLVCSVTVLWIGDADESLSVGLRLPLPICVLDAAVLLACTGGPGCDRLLMPCEQHAGLGPTARLGESSHLSTWLYCNIFYPHHRSVSGPDLAARVTRGGPAAHQEGSPTPRHGRVDGSLLVHQRTPSPYKMPPRHAPAAFRPPGRTTSARCSRNSSVVRRAQARRKWVFWKAQRLAHQRYCTTSSCRLPNTT